MIYVFYCLAIILRRNCIYMDLGSVALVKCAETQQMYGAFVTFVIVAPTRNFISPGIYITTLLSYTFDFVKIHNYIFLKFPSNLCLINLKIN